MLKLENADSLAAVFSQSAVRHSDSYVNSFAYYILTGRRSAKVYTNGENHIVTCEHPHQLGTTLIFPEIGNGASISADLLIALRDSPGNFQLARYTDLDLNITKAALSLRGNRPTAEFERIDDLDMDWVYPARILRTAKTAAMSGKDFETVRNKFNKVRENLEVHKIDVHQNLKDVHAAIHFWMGSLIAAGTQAAEQRMSFYTHLLDCIVTYPYLFDGFIVYNKSEPVGFTVWDKNLGGIANSLASLSRRSIKGLSEFQIVTSCKYLEQDGFSYLNMGGSEAESLDHHKLKFHPEKAIRMSSYKINFLEPRPADLKIIPIV